MKKATAAKATSEPADIVGSQSPSTIAAPLVRILKVKTCPNLSDSAKLGYMIGCTPDSKIKLRIYSNTGSGYFSREWVALDAVFKALDKCPKDKPLTAFWLHPIFVGKSINTPSFLMAVLLAEGLVKKVDRTYQRCDPKPFVAEMNKLIEAGVDLKGDVESKAKVKIKVEPKVDAPINKPTRKASRTATQKV